MSKVELLDKTKKKKIVQKLEKDYGIEELNYLLVRSGKENIRIFSGSLSKEELNLLAKEINIELIGTKLCTIIDEGIRLNFDLINLPEIKSQLNKSIIELNEEEMKKWMKGEDLEKQVENEKKFLLISHKGDFLGIGRNQGKFIKNYIPKERRVKWTMNNLNLRKKEARLWNK